MGEFVTAEAARERFRELADQVDAAHDQMRSLSSDEVGNAFRSELAERLETQERTNRGLMYRTFGQIADPPDEAAMAPVLVNSLAARLRIPPREVKRRMKVAGRIRPRRQLAASSATPLAGDAPWHRLTLAGYGHECTEGLPLHCAHLLATGRRVDRR